MTATVESTTRKSDSWDHDIIEEFRAHDGIVGGMFEGFPLLLLHHTGARSGAERLNPLAYQAIDGGFAIFASKGGADDDPAWLYNLRANPDTRVEIGTESVAVKARVAEGAEYDRIWNKQKTQYPTFAEYEKKTARSHIPVVVLERV